MLCWAWSPSSPVARSQPGCMGTRSVGQGGISARLKWHLDQRGIAGGESEWWQISRSCSPCGMRLLCFVLPGRSVRLQLSLPVQSLK